ncbi:MAG: hypothetical protein V4622_07435 [Bacteroidota bacterium]
MSLSIFIFHRCKIYEKTLYEATLINPKEDAEIEYTIEFKERGNYVVFESEESGLFTNYYYGTYSKKDSIIRLDRTVGKERISNKLLIRNVKEQLNDKELKELIQLDAHGKENLNKSKFRFK